MAYWLDDSGNSFRFTLPYHKGAPNVAGLIPSLVIGTALLGMISLSFFLEAIDGQLPWPFIIWWGGWWLIVGLAWLELPWRIVGHEVIEITGEAIVLQHRIGRWSISKKYPAGNINGLFVTRERDTWWTAIRRMSQYTLLDFTYGKIAFNSGTHFWGGPKTFRFGSAIGWAEAERLVARIHERLPQYRYRGRYNRL